MQTTPGHNSRALLLAVPPDGSKDFQLFSFPLFGVLPPWFSVFNTVLLKILFTLDYSPTFPFRQAPIFTGGNLGAFSISKSCRPGRNAQKRFFSSLLSLTSNSNSTSNLTYVYSLYTECIRLVHRMYTSPYTVLYTERNTKCIQNRIRLVYSLYT